MASMPGPPSPEPLATLPGTGLSESLTTGAPAGDVSAGTAAADAATTTQPSQKRQLVETRLLEYLRCLENSNREREFYLARSLNDFPLDSLEVFELITEIEEAIAVTVSDDVFDASLTVAQVIDRICAESGDRIATAPDDSWQPHA